MLSGGHPNSLGRTLEVVDIVLADQSRLKDLYQCYFCDDEVVRLRVSNAMKRVTIEHPEWSIEFLDGLQSEVAAIDRASTQWTLALLFDYMVGLMTPRQRQRSVEIMQANLEHGTDWIVLNTSMKVLGKWSEIDPDLRLWLQPHVQRLILDSRKSVSRTAERLLHSLAIE